MANNSDQHFLEEKIHLPDSDQRIGVITALWNTSITSKLKEGAITTLISAGIKKENILQWDVPGSFELTHAADKMAMTNHVDAIICIGVVIQGETRHFDFICNAVAAGITNVSIKHEIPISFGVLTTNTLQQAEERAGGKHGHKGMEAAWSTLKMLEEDAIY